MAETPRELAERLHADHSILLSFLPGEAATLILDALAATDEDYVQSQLLWIAGMYLDQHPQSFLLPRSLAEKFLISDDYDELLAGLKGIQHCGAPTTEIVERFATVMKRPDSDHRQASLYALSGFMMRTSQHINTAPATAAETRQVLRQFALEATDQLDRDLATRCAAKFDVTS